VNHKLCPPYSGNILANGNAAVNKGNAGVAPAASVYGFSTVISKTFVPPDLTSKVKSVVAGEIYFFAIVSRPL
jgi:hypothetical protein